MDEFFSSPLVIWGINLIVMAVIAIGNFLYTRSATGIKQIKTSISEKVDKVDCQKTHEGLNCWRREIIDVVEAQKKSITRIEKSLVWIVTSMGGKPNEIGLME